MKLKLDNTEIFYFWIKIKKKSRSKNISIRYCVEGWKDISEYDSQKIIDVTIPEKQKKVLKKIFDYGWTLECGNPYELDRVENYIKRFL
jgi:hypothetical protein